MLITKNRRRACLRGLGAIALIYCAQAPCLELRCPDEVLTRQSPVQDVAGWTPFVRDYDSTAGDPRTQALALHSPFAGIELYSGEPSELAQLKPDDDLARQPEWTLGPLAPADLPVYLACTYAGTQVRLVRVLPRDVKKCRDHGNGRLVCTTGR
ncbi:MAG: STY0301 family protein [Stenotrophobium sp.]